LIEATPERLTSASEAGQCTEYALVAFLNTLADTTVTSDPRFADPFRTNAGLVIS